MSEVPKHILSARDYLTSKRSEIQKRHLAGASGIRVVRSLTRMIDDLVSRLVRNLTEQLEPEELAEFEANMAVVAVGGYGREELAPFSDIDLMFLHAPSIKLLADKVVSQLVRDFWDVQLVLGSSVRTVAECLHLAKRDLTVHTALLQARHVTGSPWLTDSLKQQLQFYTNGTAGNSFLNKLEEARAQEQRDGGASAHLLEPDVKEALGGLREYHVVLWAAIARYGSARLELMERAQQISPEERTLLEEAREFLLRVRNDLHFNAGRSQDALRFDDQVRLAEQFGFQDGSGKLAVERFMQQYYRHATALDSFSRRFVRRLREHSLLTQVSRSLLATRIGREYILARGELTASSSEERAIVGSLSQMVQAFELATLTRAVLSDRTADAIRNRLAEPPHPASNQNAHESFLRILSRPGQLATTLRHMHAVGLLGKLIPEFEHVRGLIQFNQYHKYTVDEHTLFCIQAAERLRDQKTPLATAYQKIKRKEILHLALLLHDLGKGHEQDHSELGKVIAERVASEFQLPQTRAENLIFLVHKHLLMSHLAFRRDTSDARVLAEFAREVGTPEVLRMLYVMTASDISSVGPGTWTEWKSQVLNDLYVRTMELLSGDRPIGDISSALQDARTRVRNLVGERYPADWLNQHLEAMDRHYLLSNSPERIANDLGSIQVLQPLSVQTETVYLEDRQVIEVTVYTDDRITPGLFWKIAGALTVKGLQILSAEISTHHDFVVVDRFEVSDWDLTPPSQERLEEISSFVNRVLQGDQAIDAKLITQRRIVPGAKVFPEQLRDPTKVRIDNDMSDQFTVVDVFATDHQGLLYTITHTLFDLDVSVSIAKIATSLDQVLDVFYLTDSQGRKILDPQHLKRIKEGLEASIEQFELAAQGRD